MKRHSMLVTLLVVLAQTATVGVSEPTLTQEPESPAQTAAARSRVNRYFKNKVANPKLKECWGRLTGEGSIAMDFTYRRSGGAWTFDSIEVTGSTLPQEQVALAVQCLQDAAQATSFPVNPGAFYEKGAKEFVLRWTWPVPLEPSTSQASRTAGLMNTGGTASSCQVCAFRGVPPYGQICKAATSGGYKVCQLHGTPPSNSCSFDKACLSGGFAGLR